MSIGLELEGSIDEAVANLQQRGLTFEGPINRAKAGAFIGFSDPDGHSLYLGQLNMMHINAGQGEYSHA